MRREVALSLLVLAASLPTAADAGCLAHVQDICRGTQHEGFFPCAEDTIDVQVGPSGDDPCDGIDVTVLGSERNDTRDFVDISVGVQEHNDDDDTVDLSVGGYEQPDRRDTASVEVVPQTGCVVEVAVSAVVFCTPVLDRMQ